MGALDRVFRGRRGGQERPLSAIIAGLWRNGEQGVWYDVGSFRDSWNQVGPELLSNGDFSAGVASWWLKPGQATVSNRLDVASGDNFLWTTGAVFTPGKLYVVSVTYFKTAGLRLRISSSAVVGSGFTIHAESASLIDNAVTTLRLLVQPTAQFLSVQSAGALFSGWISNVSVKEWIGQGLCALYQDASGTLPCYLPGQGQVDPPVGLLLDKRKGLTRGPEMLSNGDFSGGAASWGVSGTDATHIVTFENGAMRYQSDTTSPQLSVNQGAILTVGAWYEVVVTVSAWVSGSLKSDSLSGVGAAPVVGSAVGTFIFIGRAIVSTFSLTRNTANTDLTIDSISVRELPGNHAYQTTTTSRPTLSARYNMLVSTEQLSSAAWVKLNTGTGLLPTVTDAAAVSPRGTMTASRIVLNKGAGATTSDQSAIFQNVQIASGVIARRGVWLRTTADTGNINIFLDSTGGTGFGVVVTVTPAWQYFSVTNDTDSNNGRGIRLAVRGGFGTSDSADILAWGFDVRPANDGVGLPEYQRVADASNYDTTGFPLYLKFDGVDDFLQTASIDFSAYARIVIAASIRKLSDATAGTIAELSPIVNTNSGTFALFGTLSTSTPGIGLRYSGATPFQDLHTPLAGQASAVVLVTVELDGAGAKVAVNGTWYSNPSPAGGGVLGNYPLYIGRRAGSSLPFSGRLFALQVRGGGVAASQLTAMGRYLNQKARVY